MLLQWTQWWQLAISDTPHACHCDPIAPARAIALAMVCSSRYDPAGPSAALAEAALQYARIGDPALSMAVQGIGNAVRAVHATQREAAVHATRQHQKMVSALGSPSVSDARSALDKASKRFDKDKYKKRGSLQLRGLSLEVHQRALQQVHRPPPHAFTIVPSLRFKYYSRLVHILPPT
jgi:hypothetical protein